MYTSVCKQCINCDLYSLTHSALNFALVSLMVICLVDGLALYYCILYRHLHRTILLFSSYTHSFVNANLGMGSGGEAEHHSL